MRVVKQSAIHGYTCLFFEDDMPRGSWNCLCIDGNYYKPGLVYGVKRFNVIGIQGDDKDFVGLEVEFIRK